MIGPGRASGGAELEDRSRDGRDGRRIVDGEEDDGVGPAVEEAPERTGAVGEELGPVGHDHETAAISVDRVLTESVEEIRHGNDMPGVDHRGAVRRRGPLRVREEARPPTRRRVGGDHGEPPVGRAGADCELGDQATDHVPRSRWSRLVGTTDHHEDLATTRGTIEPDDERCVGEPGQLGDR